MKHVLLSVGCNSYDHVDDLGGAENDAVAIFESLTDSLYGDCSALESILIRSPNFQEMREAVIEMASRIGRDDVLTFFFAGHGIVRNNTFYMCPSDTHPDRVGATAYALNSFLAAVQEASPRHANILIDACSSGGVAGDFKRALSQEGVGDTGTIGISLLAACARNQAAYEENERGVFTSQVLDCITGSAFIQDSTQHLDLADVTRVISRRMASNAGQQPVFWGLNLTGNPNFCRNPHASADTLKRVLAEAKPLNLSGHLKRELQTIHDELDDSWEPNRLQRVLEELFDASVVAEELKLNFSNQVLQSLRAKARSAEDPFREIEVAVACLSPLVGLCANNEFVESYVVKECQAIAEQVFTEVRSLLEALDRDQFALIGSGGFGEFFFLPIRISKLLGWLGWAIYVRGATGADSDLLSELLKKINDLYTGSIRSISESQAPHLVACCAAAFGTTAQEQVEELVGHLFTDACESRALIASHGLDKGDLVSFLLSRAKADRSDRTFAANPSVLIFSLLCVAAHFELDEAFDVGLEDLDHINVNAFIPETYADFFKTRISDGYNASIRIGHEIWKTEDLRKIVNRIEWPIPETLGVSILSAASSLVFTDRVAWHLLMRGGKGLEG